MLLEKFYTIGEAKKSNFTPQFTPTQTTITNRDKNTDTKKPPKTGTFQR